MNDIGFVQYSKSNTDNIIEARWHYLKNGLKISGTGIVRGKIDENYSGDFHVTYYNIDGQETSNFQLKINFEADHYQLKWIKDGNVEYIGIGVEYDNILFAGWRKFKKMADIC